MKEIDFKYGNRLIRADLQYSDRKSIGLRVFPEGNILITAPTNISVEKIIEKVKPKSKWIIAQQRAFELYKPFTTERKYIAGETHRYLGRQYKLVINKIERGKTTVSLAKGLMTITTPKDNIEKIILDFYKDRAGAIFDEILESLKQKFPQFNAFETLLSHKYLKKRWGSCSINGSILLNTELIKASKACIEYVILHELCHLIHPNHSKEFYQLLKHLFPNWEKVKNKLEQSIA